MRRNLHAERTTGRGGDNFVAAARRPRSADPQIAAQIRASGFESKTRQGPYLDLHETASERGISRHLEPCAGRGQRWNNESIGLRLARVRRISDGNDECRSAQEILDPQVHNVRDVSPGTASLPRF